MPGLTCKLHLRRVYQLNTGTTATTTSTSNEVSICIGSHWAHAAGELVFACVRTCAYAMHVYE